MSGQARNNNKWSALAALLTISIPMSVSAQQPFATATTTANGLTFRLGSGTFTLGNNGAMTVPNGGSFAINGVAQPFDGTRLNMVNTMYGLSWSCAPGTVLTMEGSGNVTCAAGLPTNCPAGDTLVSNGAGGWYCNSPAPPPPPPSPPALPSPPPPPPGSDGGGYDGTSGTDSGGTDSGDSGGGDGGDG